MTQQGPAHLYRLSLLSIKAERKAIGRQVEPWPDYATALEPRPAAAHTITGRIGLRDLTILDARGRCRPAPSPRRLPTRPRRWTKGKTPLGLASNGRGAPRTGGRHGAIFRRPQSFSTAPNCPRLAHPTALRPLPRTYPHARRAYDLSP